MVRDQHRDWIFIDALCINQDESSEKPTQVALMGDVYRRAEEVLAWIVYEPEPDSESDVDDVKEEHVLAGGVEYQRDMIASMTREQLERAILGNSYWSRLWIVQEVLLAKRLTIRMGSAEAEWLNLIPEKTAMGHRGPPIKNARLNLRQESLDPWANRSTALNLLSYRRFEYKSLRAGNHLPFHKAFDFFATQRCGRRHDRVYGYLGLTNSRIQVDYSMPILDLFVATLSDYLLSAAHVAITQANDLVAPLIAFDLDLYDPVVNVLFYEVAKFFAPGFEQGLWGTAMGTWWSLRNSHASDPNFHAFLEEEFKFEFLYIGSACIKFAKLMASEMRACTAKTKEVSAEKKLLEGKDALLIDKDSGRVQKRYQESGLDADGDLGDDESWTMIA
ncbi:hypothetical protein ACEQ8H_005950 [Pleosporales sp. CAS-2024a]